MALQLGRTVSDGIRRVFSRTGGLLLVGLLGIQLLVQASVNTAVVGLFPAEMSDGLAETVGLTLPVPGTVGAGLVVIALVLNAAYFVVLSRAFTRPAADLGTFPSRLYTRRMGRATLSTTVGGVLVGVAVMVGLLLLVLPGLFLAVSFLFFLFAVGVEDRGVVGGLRRSWALSVGNRLKLGLIVVLGGAIGGVGGVVGSVLQLAGTPAVAELVTIATNSVLFLVLYGIMAAAYLQVRDDGSDGAGDGTAVDPMDGGATVDQ